MTSEPARGYAKGRAKREEILDAATTLFAEVGYNGASLREIAARCGITHPGLIHHFPTKAALLAAVLERRDIADSEELGFQMDQGAPTLARFTDLVAQNAKRHRVIEMYTALSAEATSPAHPAHDFFVERYRHIRGEIVSLIVLAQESGDVDKHMEPKAAAAALMALMDGLQLQWLLDPDEVDMVRVFDMALHTILGWAPQPMSDPAMPGAGM